MSQSVLSGGAAIYMEKRDSRKLTSNNEQPMITNPIMVALQRPILWPRFPNRFVPNIYCRTAADG